MKNKTKKEEKKVKKVEPVMVKVKCEWCGKDGFVREAVFCSEECKEAFLATNTK